MDKINGASVGEIMQKVRTVAEQNRADNHAADNLANDIGGADGGADKTNRINLSINDSRAKSRIRTKIPDALNRFPINKSKILQKIILKFYEILFREQRNVSNAILDVLQELSLSRLELLAETKNIRHLLDENVRNIIGRMDSMDSEIGVLINKTDKSDAAVKDIFRNIGAHKTNIVDMQRRIMRLLEEFRKMRDVGGNYASAAQAIIKEDDSILDALYLTFEDKFRGTRQDIKNRQKAYLPYIMEALDKTGSAPVLDLGCGRGEWLELLGEKGIKASGVDTNEVMVELCAGFSLEASKANALEYMRSLPPSSLSAVTGFHILEHMPFKNAVAVLDESFRVIKSGGIIIFETPNPENLMVGACTFYIDPSHIKPLVPATMEFIAEDRGFINVTVKRMNKYSDFHEVAEENENNRFIKENFYNEMDYSVIGVKP